jgi:hypothetical protein
MCNFFGLAIILFCNSHKIILPIIYYYSPKFSVIIDVMFNILAVYEIFKFWCLFNNCYWVRNCTIISLNKTVTTLLTVLHPYYAKNMLKFSLLFSNYPIILLYPIIPKIMLAYRAQT